MQKSAQGNAVAVESSRFSAWSRGGKGAWVHHEGKNSSTRPSQGVQKGGVGDGEAPSE